MILSSLSKYRPKLSMELKEKLKVFCGNITRSNGLLNARNEICLLNNLALDKLTNSSKTGSIFMVDHVFALKGQGTVFTGTLLVGSLQLNDTVEIPDSGELKKIKSIHAYKQPLSGIQAGDRAGLCVSGVELARLTSERLLLGTPGSILRQISWIFCSFSPISHFKHEINSKYYYWA